MASNMLAPADKPSDTDGFDDAAAAMLRLANQQFGDFEGARSLYARAYLLFRECCREGEARVGKTIDEILFDTTGLDTEKILFLPLGLYAVLGKTKGGWRIDPNVMTNSPDFPGITGKDVQNLFDWLSIDYEGLRKARREPKVGAEEGYEPYNFNPLVKHPIVRTPDGYYVIPVIHYLFRRVTVGLFYDLVRSADQGRAGDILGHAFESYVRRLIEDLPRHGRLLPEQTYGGGRTTCEWILDEPEGVVIIECKRISLRQRAKTTGNKNDVKSDLAREGGVADGIAKMAETAQAIRQGLLKGVSPDRRILPLLITFDQFFLANSLPTRKMLKEVWDEQSADVPQEFPYQICSISDFEELCSMLSAAGGSIASALISKADGKFNVVGDYPTEQWDVSSWVTRAQSGAQRGSLPSHDAVFHGGLDTLIGRFGRRA